MNKEFKMDGLKKKIFTSIIGGLSPSDDFIIGVEYAIERITQGMVPNVRIIPNADTLEISINNVDMSNRLHNCLYLAGKKTIGDVVATPLSELYRIENFGRKTARELSDIVKSYGLELRNDTSLVRRIAHIATT